MIKEKTGNLIESLESGEINVACHCCNCQATMGAGIAKALADKYPEIRYADRKAHSRHNSLLGSFSGVRIRGNKFVVNLYGQETFGGKRAVNYEAIYTSMEKLRQFLEEKEKFNLRIGFPKKMASDLAGGDWNVIKAMIESVWVDWPSDVYIVELKS